MIENFPLILLKISSSVTFPFNLKYPAIQK
jgi:hypothetical protein